jgi:hypothetical protein
VPNVDVLPKGTLARNHAESGVKGGQSHVQALINIGKVQWALLLALSGVAAPVFAQLKLIGVGVHAGGLSAERQEAQLALVKQAHLGSVRFDLQWRYVETTQGQYSIPTATERFVDSAIKLGIEPVIILDYGNSFYDGGDKPRSQEAINAFVRYAAFVVSHFRGRVHQFEVWNEWDNHTGGYPAASPEDYALVFKAAYPVLKKANADAKIIVGSGVRQGWGERLAELGVVQMGDGLAIHPYNYQIADDRAPEHCVQNIVRLEQRLRSLTHQANVDLYVTEIGWPTNLGRFGARESAVGSYASRLTLLTLSLPYVKGLWWYDLVDDGTDPFNKEHNFGLFHTDLKPKPSATAIAAAAEFADTHALSLVAPGELDAGRIVIEATRRKDAQQSLLIWDLIGNNDRIDIDCASSGAVRVGTRTSAASVMPAVPTVVTAQSNQCVRHPVDPS